MGATPSQLAVLLALACTSPAPGATGAPPEPRPAPESPEALRTARGERPAVTLLSPSGRAATVRVELARTRAEHERGLMWRTSLGAGEGMLFLFGEASDHAFWMKNTPLSLDLVFLDAAGEVVGLVERAEPMTAALRSVGRSSRAVLEVNAGWVAAHHVQVGDRAQYQGFALE